MTTPPQDPFAKQPAPQDPYGQQPGYPPPPAAGYQQPYPPQQPYAQQPYGAPPAYGAPGYPAAPPAGYAPVGGPGSPAGMGNRLLARIIDALIVGIPSFIIMAVAGAGFFADAKCTTNAAGTSLDCSGVSSGLAGFFVAYLIIFVLAILYELYFIGTRGQTPGKMAMGVKVIDSQTGGHIGMGRAFVRYLVLGITGSICTLGYWSPFFDNSGRKQGWHDKAANDLVVSTK